ncbi:unnamed protein product [Blepharisma stoltei]|uniref:3-hydroxyisobutyryl-CoA hydrolase n=1 Tax=Blepharisma stoltei TaxID=1481888 RepID=A0AAU9IC15_9CILI|nr:unnamed protein product [Blepharisma stoltei]
MESALNSSFILYEEIHSTFFIKLNRPESLNSFNMEMLNILHSLSRRAKLENKNILWYGEGRALSAGGDIVIMTKGEVDVEEIFESESKLWYSFSQIPTIRIAIMDGITFGGGAGLAWSCSIRVATPKTLWSMPECSIGYCPDVGASHFLSRVNPSELGLYLSLAAERLNGIDCYLFGFAEYYIEKDKKEIIREMQSAGNLIEILEKYHIDPDRNKSKILPVLKELRYCFDVHLNLEIIIYRLKLVGSDWSLKTLKRISELCPLSLRIAKEAFRRGIHMSYRESLIMEYNLAAQLIKHQPTNFNSAVNNKLITKNQKKIEWNPDSIISIGDTTIMPYFINSNGRKLQLPRL